MTFQADLKKEVHAIFALEWNERVGKVVPDPKSLSPGNDAVKLNATVLYADMADSTDLVDHHEHPFAAELYKTYLRCAATIIKSESGNITAYDGDRVMAIFLGDLKNTSAARSALKINYAVQKIINPSLQKQYPRTKYQLKHVVGIDTSELFVTRVGVRNDSDLVWVGRAANYAAKLCSLNGKHSVYITRAVFNALEQSTKYSNQDNRSLIWEKETWRARSNRIIYGSSYQWPID